MTDVLYETCRPIEWFLEIGCEHIREGIAQGPQMGGLPGLFGLAAVARRLHLSVVWSQRGLASWRWSVQVLGVQYAQFGDRGYDL